MARIKSNIDYYNSIEVILNPKEYYMLTFEDIHEMYGQPKGTGSARSMYDMGEYTLFFGYDHGYVSFISYMPNEPFKYRRSPEDAFYLFGLEDDRELFYQEKLQKNVFRAKDENYLECLILADMDEKTNTAGHVTIYFKENLPNRKVFEGDFTDTEVIFDMVKFIGKDKNYVIDNIGRKNRTTQYGNIIYYTDIGEYQFGIDSDEKVIWVEVTPNGVIQYNESPQEAMVMFGVNPRLSRMYLYDYSYSDDGYANFELYRNFDGRDGGIIIGGIDTNNKTFDRVFMRQGIE